MGEWTYMSDFQLLPALLPHNLDNLILRQLLPVAHNLLIDRPLIPHYLRNEDSNIALIDQ
jgi:hypothetical protein